MDNILDMGKNEFSNQNSNMNSILDHEFIHQTTDDCSTKKVHHNVDKTVDTGLPVFEYTSSKKRKSKSKHSKKEKKIPKYEAEVTPTRTSVETDRILDMTKLFPDNDGFQVNPTIQRMMSRMDYKKGKGLGKYEQGVKAPIELSKQKGRRGLGFEIAELDEAIKEFDPKNEIINVEETVEWLSSHFDNLDEINYSQWKLIGNQKLTLDGEVHFCDSNVLDKVLSSKSIFDRLDKNEMRHARTRSNPFETIRNGFFQNRAALKMANLDRICDYIFTNPKNLNKEILHFADVCAGPGGFSEYVLWRRKLEAKGFGFTLKKSNDFKLDDFLAGPTENFHPYYGPTDDPDKMGDVFLPENQLAFKKVIMEHTNNLGVHFMMADGGFSVDGQNNIQEILSKQLYLCQCLVALMIVRKGGHFVTKLFDVFTPFSAGLIYMMYMSFDSISIIKPNTSRPANSERYLVCKGKRSNTSYIEEYLFNINCILNEKNKFRDVIQIVPMDIMKEDTDFYNYLTSSNNELGLRQITGLIKIAHYTENKTLVEPKQAEIRMQCLQYWGIPRNIKRMDFKPITIDEFLNYNSVQTDIDLCMKSSMKVYDSKSLQYPYSYYYSILQYCPEVSPIDSAPTMYIGLGGSKVYKKLNNNWSKVDGIILPAKTVVYAEEVFEYDKEKGRQMKKKALHVVDAYMIDGICLNNYSIKERNQKVKLMCKVLWGLSDRSSIPVRCKPLYELKRDIYNKLNFLKVSLKGKLGHRLGYAIARDELTDEPDVISPYFIVPGSILFFNFTRQPYTRNWSKSNKMFYYFNGSVSLFEQDMLHHKDHISNFVECYQSRIIWSWVGKGCISFDEFIKQNEMRLLR